MTMNFTLCNFMVGFLLDFNRSSEVSQVFNNLRKVFSENSLNIKDIMPIILTDNGSEFSDVDSIENDGEISLFSVIQCVQTKRDVLKKIILCLGIFALKGLHLIITQMTP